MLSIVSLAVVLFASFRHSDLAGYTTVEMLPAVTAGTIGRILAVVATLTIGVFLMTICQLSSRRWIENAVRQEEKTVALPIKRLFPVVSLILALPTVGDVWLKVAEALLVSTYPMAAVLMIFYAVISKPEELRKQHSLRYAFNSVVVFSFYMLIYHITRNFGIDALLIQGIYESMLLSKGNLTWIVIATVFFIIGDTNYRKKEEKNKRALLLEKTDSN